MSSLVKDVAYFALACVLAGLAVGFGEARAGGGPENVLVVVNSASWASQAVANHFVSLRHIPAGNVLYLDWTGDLEHVDAEAFRQKVLGPALEWIARRGIATQIDYIVYSSDFPSSVSLVADLGSLRTPPQLSTLASCTGATYLWQLVMSKNPAAVGLRNNFYMRSAAGHDAATHGFRSWYGWDPGGRLVEGGGMHYMLSTMLAVTSGRGNSVPEAIGYLKRSAAADGTRPKGTIYYCSTKDVRSVTRTAGFETAVEQLKELGVAADIISTDVPSNRPDVQGLMTGTAKFSWPTSRSEIMPGAICENLTSFGGVMAEEAGQTPFTELLRYGAAGSSGTVAEPYSIIDKFPSPQVHVHYARGCSLAEAFYQSVFGPYQLLIVGDPLCQPWAGIPQVRLDSPRPGEKVAGVIALKPLSASGSGARVDRYELFVDGRRMSTANTEDRLVLDTKTLPDGHHELRVVAIQSSPVESQGRLIVPIIVDNHGRRVEVAATPKNRVRWDQRLTIQAKAPGAIGIAVLHNGRLVGKIQGGEGSAVIDPRSLGLGGVRLETVALRSARERVIGPPIRVTVTPPKAMAPVLPGERKMTRGLRLKLTGGDAVTIQQTRTPKWLAEAGVKPNETFELSGYFESPQLELAQFQIRHRGGLKVVVDNVVLYEQNIGDYERRFLPVMLEAGVHRLVVSGRAADEVQLEILFGSRGTSSIDGQRFRQPG